MKAHDVIVLSVLTLLLSLAGIALAEESADLGTALTSGKVGVNVRARYEHVDQDNISDSADAVTARLRFNYRTGQWNGLTGFVEYDYVFHILNDFNSGGGTSPDKGNFPVVADPKGADLNQLYLDYGTELDVSAGTKLSDNYGVLFKGAFFSSDSASYPDTDKFWIMFTANY